MSKKVLLSEEQFKEYVKLLKESEDMFTIDDVSADYSLAIEKLQRTLSYIEQFRNEFSKRVNEMTNALAQYGHTFIGLTDEQINFKINEEFANRYRSCQTEEQQWDLEDELDDQLNSISVLDAYRNDKFIEMFYDVDLNNMLIIVYYDSFVSPNIVKNIFRELPDV